MSMYTQLLDAAYGERPAWTGSSKGDAIDEARRRRGDLTDGVGAGVDADTVPFVLALELGYDMALLELAGLLGIDSDPSRFELPQHERHRLEAAFRTRGISLDATD